MMEVRNVGLIPETKYARYSGVGSIYDYLRSADYPFDELRRTSDLATSKDRDTETYIEFLSSDYNAIRYWGVVGLLINSDDAGAVQNLKLSRELHTTYRRQTESLLQTYFEKGGAQLMINCLNRSDLENAMKEPE